MLPFGGSARVDSALISGGAPGTRSASLGRVVLGIGCLMLAT